MKPIPLPLTDYLKLSNTDLRECRTSTTGCVISLLPDARLRLVTMIAPVDHCWGMDFAQSALYRKTGKQIEYESSALSVMKNCCKTVDSLDQIMQGLIPLQVKPSDDGFEYGRKGEPIDYWWFRSYVLTDNDRLFEHFIQCWTRHEQQLGKYFLMPYSDDSVNSSRIPQSTPPWQLPDIHEKLFCTRIAQGRRGFSADDLIALLEAYQSEEKSQELDRSISPEFCLQEYIRIGGALTLENFFFRKYVDLLANIILGPAYSSQAKVKRKVAILRIRIARSLEWPLGARHIAEQLNERSVSTPGSSSLLREAMLFKETVETKYPVLFEDFTGKIR